MKKTTTIATIIMTALAILLLSGTNASAQVTASESMLLGSWSADMVATAALSGEELSAEEMAFMSAMSVTFTFNADHTMNAAMSMMGQTESETATWAPVGAEGPVLTITSTNTEGETEVVVLTFNTEQNVTATADGETFVLNRVVPTP